MTKAQMENIMLAFKNTTAIMGLCQECPTPIYVRAKTQAGDVVMSFYGAATDNINYSALIIYYGLPCGTALKANTFDLYSYEMALGVMKMLASF